MPALESVVDGLIGLIREHSYIDGFAIGGSLARGKYKKGHYAYTTVLCQPPKRHRKDDLASEFSRNSRIRLRILGWEYPRFSLSELSPETIYVFRSENERKAWNPPKARYYFAKG